MINYRIKILKDSNKFTYIPQKRLLYFFWKSFTSDIAFQAYEIIEFDNINDAIDFIERYRINKLYIPKKVEYKYIK